jgi:hypothetical protein
VRAEPGADAGLMIDGQLRKLASLPGGRWTAGEPWAAGPAPSSKPAGVDFARREELEARVKAKGILAVIGGSSDDHALGGLFDQKSGGGGFGLGRAVPLEGTVSSEAGELCLPAPSNTREGRLTIRRGRKLVWRGRVNGAGFELPELWDEVRYSWKFESKGAPDATGSFRVKPAASMPAR